MTHRNPVKPRRRRDDDIEETQRFPAVDAAWEKAEKLTDKYRQDPQKK